MVRIDHNAGRKNIDQVTVEAVGSGEVIEMMMRGNLLAAASCSVPVYLSTFYTKCVELKNSLTLPKSQSGASF